MGDLTDSALVRSARQYGGQKEYRRPSQIAAVAMESILQQRANHTLFPLKRIFFVLQPASEAAAANRGYLSVFV